MAVSKEQVLSLLGHGLSNEVVATTVGCDPSYITQLMSDENFSSEVVKLRSATLTANSERDRKIDKIEDELLTKLEDNLPMIYKPNEILRAFATVNLAKRRGVPAHESMLINQTIVNLNIPTVVVQRFVTNTQGEVIEAEGQTLVTMPARDLLSRLVSSKGEADGRFKEIANHLPPGEDAGITYGAGNLDRARKAGAS